MKIYREIIRNTDMGICSIENLIGYVECEKLKDAMCSQKEVMEDFYKRAKEELGKQELENAESSKLQRGMLKAGVHVNAMFNRDAAHIAEMLIDGYNMGIVSVQKCINELQNDGVEVPMLAKDLMKSYDKHIKTMRTFL